ncbi:carboxymuconolactone decarboxylase family protein [Undibacterium arcticum]
MSQVNGCAYCIDLHARDLLANGEDWQRVNSLVGWRETSFYSARERAALAWAEAVTAIADTHAPDALFEALKEHFCRCRNYRTDLCHHVDECLESTRDQLSAAGKEGGVGRCRAIT